MPGLLQNHIAVVTGAGSGIGRGIALGYGREGAQVVALDINGETAGKTATDIRAEGGVNVIVQPIEGLDADALLELSDRYKQKHAPAAVVLGSREDGKVHLVANFDDSVAVRVSASDVVREAAAIVGGGGGGRPNMARAGGKDPEKLPDALARAEELIISAL